MLAKITFFLFAVTALFLISPVSTSYGVEATTGTITAQLRDIINSVDPQEVDITLYIVDVKTGRIIFGHNEERALIPASCNKLLTTAAAFYQLGSEYCYKTRIYYSGTPAKKILNGDIYVVGSGDPTISGRFNPDDDKNDVTWTFKIWAEKFRDLRIKTVYGNVIGDDSVFDDDYFGKGWPADERSEWYCAEISGLSFNDNCIDVHWGGAKKAGEPALFTLNPPTKYVNFLNGVRTVEKDGRLRTRFSRDDKSNIIRAEGTIPVRRKVTDYPTIYNPTAYCVTVLKETFEKKGITIMGKALDLDEQPETEPDYEQMYLVDTFVSPPLASLVKVINRNSQNFYADQVLKTMGKEINGEGSFVAGCRAVIAFLEKENIYIPGTLMVDGSGLSRFNRVSSKQLVTLLQFMAQHPDRNIFFDSLPQGGVSGTLSGRFQKTEESRALAPRIFGKTGYLGGVNSMTGVIETRQGQKVYYSIIVNSSAIDTSQRIDLIDRIALALANMNYV